MSVPEASHRAYTWRYTDTLLVFLAGVVASLIAGIIAFAATGAEELTAPWLFWLVLPAQFAGTYAALYWVSRRRGTGAWEQDFGFRLDLKDFWYLGVGMAVLIGTGLIAELVRIVLQLEDDNPQVLIDIVDQVGTGPTVFAMVASLVIFGPIAEELTYRGLFLRTVQERHGATAATVVSAVVFAAVHLTDPALVSKQGIPTLLALALVGLVLAWVTVRSRDLSRAIFIHGGFNLMTTLSLLFADLPTAKDAAALIAWLR